MPIAKAFNILAHFKFEVGGAIASSRRLESQLDKLSSKAKDVQDQFKVMFFSSALQLTGGQAGILGILKNAIGASNDFYESQRKLSMVISGNIKHLKVLGSTSNKSLHDFKKVMGISSSILAEMTEEANKYGIPMNQFVSTFNTLNPLLVPKGAAGTNFAQSRKLSRNLMMGANVLGMSPLEAQGQMMTIIEGRIQNPNQTLFSRLRQETDAFKGMTPAQVRGFSASKRVDMLNKAFDQYLEKSGVLEAHLGDLGTQLTILNNHFKSLGSVLKPLGDVIRGPLVQALQEFNKWAGTQLKKTIKLISRELKPFVSSLEELYISISRLASLGGTFRAAKGLSSLFFIIFELGKYVPWVAKQLAKFGLVVGAGLGAALGGVLKTVFKTATALQGFRKLLGFIGAAFVSYMKFFLPILAIGRMLDAAKAKAATEDVKKFGENTSALAEKLIHLKREFQNIIAPISYLIKYLGESVSFLFQRSFWIEKVYNLLNKFGVSFENFGEGLIILFGTVEAGIGILGSALIELAKIVVPFSGQFLNISKAFSQIKDIKQYAGGFLVENIEKHLKGFEALKARGRGVQDAPKPENIVNIGKVEIKNQFKENYEPDRIAVTIKETLLKAAQSPIDTTSRDQVFTPGSLVGA